MARPDSDDGPSPLEELRGLFDEMLALFAELPAKRPDPEALAAAGDILAVLELVNSGKSDLAREAALELVEKYPGRADIQHFAALMLLHLGLELEAITAFVTALALDPNHYPTYPYLAKLLLDTGSPNRSAAVLTAGWERMKPTVPLSEQEAARSKWFAIPEERWAPE